MINAGSEEDKTFTHSKGISEPGSVLDPGPQWGLDGQVLATRCLHSSGRLRRWTSTRMNKRAFQTCAMKRVNKNGVIETDSLGHGIIR